MESQKATEILKKIIQPSYLPKYLDWKETASTTELKGLEIMNFIFDTRGHQKANRTGLNESKTVKELYHQPFKYPPLLALTI